MMERKYIWDKITADDKAAMEQTAVKYMDCISACKTELKLPDTETSTV